MEINDLRDLMGAQTNDALLGYFRIKSICEIKSMLQNNEDDYFINCLVCGDTDVDLHQLDLVELKLMNALQKMNISLIKANLPKAERVRKLSEAKEFFSIEHS